MKNFIIGLRIVDGIKKLVLYSNKNRSTSKSKHINFKFLIVKERVESGHKPIEHIDIDPMVAKLLAKELPPKAFHEHTVDIGVIPFKDIRF